MSKEFETPVTPAIACDLSAIETEDLNQHMLTVK